MTAIVSDTTALIVLADQERLNLLGACFRQVLIPQAVYLEWRAGESNLDSLLEQLPFFEIVTVEDNDLLRELRSLLDSGESEALALAKQLQLPLLIDEKKGRSLARLLNVSVLGLAGVLVLAVRRDILDASTAKQIIDRARDHGFRLSAPLYQAVLEQLGLS